jgi:hypothetical protein
VGVLIYCSVQFDSSQWWSVFAVQYLDSAEVFYLYFGHSLVPHVTVVPIVSFVLCCCETVLHLHIVVVESLVKRSLGCSVW